MKTTYRSKSKIITGDLFKNIENYITSDHNGCSIIVPHVCNNINLFSAGFAAGIAKHYPIVKENYHVLGNNFLKNNLGYTQFITVLKEEKYNHRLIFANMIAQNGTISKSNQRPLNYYSLIKCMESVKQYIKLNFTDENRIQIHSPKFGCGLAGGDWNFIQNLIEDIWSDIDIFIYQL